jgi:hypothetical protein
MIDENPDQVAINQLAGFPAFCISGTTADGRVAWIDLWGASPPSGDDEADYAVGRTCGDAAIEHARDHKEYDFIEAVLIFMADRLVRERRSLGRLEFGFLDRVVIDYPGVVERTIGRCIRGALGGGSLCIRGGEAEAIARHNADSRY